MTATAREVVCARCAGRSAVDPEYASLPAWACPFCATVNAMPAAQKPKRDRSLGLSIAAAALVAAIVIISVALQTTNPRPPPRTIAGVVDALDRAGLSCRDIRADPAFPPARETGSCMLGDRPISILTFTGSIQRDRTIGKLPSGHHAAGETWIVRAPDARIARAIALALKGYLLEEE